MTRYVLVVSALFFFGCDTSPPEPDHHLAEKIDGLNTILAQNIAELNELIACMRRENDRLREERATLDAKIAAALDEAAAFASAQPRKPDRRP